MYILLCKCFRAFSYNYYRYLFFFNYVHKKLLFNFKTEVIFFHNFTLIVALILVCTINR